MTNIIGIAGTARAGKDTFATLLSTHLAPRHVVRYAFADELKRELDPFFKSFGGTAFETDSAKKAIIRPILISHGREKRLISNGRYWIDKIESSVKKSIQDGNIVLITDVRYNTHDTDECSWVKSLGGKIVYIERIDENGIPVQPANEEEIANDPLLRKGADVILSWPTIKDIYSLFPYVEKAAKQIGL